jgi:hypothetical protein
MKLKLRTKAAKLALIFQPSFERRSSTPFKTSSKSSAGPTSPPERRRTLAEKIVHLQAVDAEAAEVVEMMVDRMLWKYARVARTDDEARELVET